MLLSSIASASTCDRRLASVCMLVLIVYTQGWHVLIFPFFPEKIEEVDTELKILIKSEE